MSPATLLAELRRRGITVGVTPNGRLRLTGPSEDALTPELQRAVAAQRVDLLALLRGEAAAVGGANVAPSASQATSIGPPPADPQAEGPADAQQSDGDAAIPAWLGWGAAAVGAILLVGYYLASRPQAPAVSEPAPPTSPAFPLGVPYSGWGTWGQ